MTTEKIAVTVPREVVRKARQAVKNGAARSLSAYVSRALENQTMDDDLSRMLDEMFAQTGGPPTGAERAQAREDLYGDPPRRRKR